MDWIRRDKEAYTPEWVTMFKNMGVNIAHLMDFHTDGHARDLGQVRLTELKDYFDLTRQLSGPDFLVIPGEELWEYFGGHWAVLFPKPVYYYLRRNPDQPFEQQIAPYGSVYRIGSAEDMLTLLHREGGMAWQTHPRTKGSVGFPDSNKDKFFTRDAAWLGGGFKAMPSDYSSPRLGERALNLLDDMNNWGQRKALIGEVDVFKIDHTHELYAHMNINYVKLDQTPPPSDWSALNGALSRGEFFTTTGEVLIRDSRITLSHSKLSLEANVEWTFPLNFVELVWGDGEKTYRKMVSASETKEFGRQDFSIAVDAPGAKWARFAVWDIAADGAFTTPIRFDKAE
jgi:dihydrofolate reductase